MVDEIKKGEETVQDGFDAIEYPVDFAFKAVCEIETVASLDELHEIINQAVASIVGQAALKDVSSKESRAGKYVSVTTTARIKSRQQLEGIYSAISSLDVVKMTL